MRISVRILIVVAALAILAATSAFLTVARTEHGAVHKPQQVRQPTPGRGDVPDSGGFQ